KTRCALTIGAPRLKYLKFLPASQTINQPLSQPRQVRPNRAISAAGEVLSKDHSSDSQPFFSKKRTPTAKSFRAAAKLEFSPATSGPSKDL
ncbi:MAG: hypothetical protein AB8B71_10880, partial [Paracoccaceae bacterium]